MLLRNTMFVWTPNRGQWTASPNAGKIVATEIPEAVELRAHPMSTGACDLSWREADDPTRRKLLQRYFTQWVHRDGVTAAVARQALEQIEDVNPNSLSDDAPDPNDDSWR